ncbi:M14 family zinc carboxypeptidase [Allohahella marinimesophila]|uniref:M14 family metallopeptidase n=1 Tax=Allohahella marinimesophila TaxID=1054972 RepID=A0ABP7NPY8_9GAMM
MATLATRMRNLSSKTRHKVPELEVLRLMAEHNPASCHLQLLDTVSVKQHELPIYAMKIGHADSTKPALALVGGIHGIERIGTEIILAFVRTLLARLRWDDALRAELDEVQLWVLPAMNPSGMWLNSRCNAAGVDLMRNAPVEASTAVPLLLGGQRLSRKLPWFRGIPDQLEPESAALCKFARTHLFPAPFSMVLDCHSGFGFKDQLWFPYACTNQPIEHLAEVYAFHKLLAETYPHNIYTFEPQANVYTTHGDLWDYLYQGALAEGRCFLPLTMELGSWQWVRKNPRQLTQLLGFYHPILPHRLERVLRRHLTFLDFMKDAVRSHANWLPDDDERLSFEAAAQQLWYA